MFYGQPHVTGGLASVINATTPLFTILIARIFAQEPLSARQDRRRAAGLAGVAVLMGPAAANMHATSLLGMSCFVGAASPMDSRRCGCAGSATPRRWCLPRPADLLVRLMLLPALSRARLAAAAAAAAVIGAVLGLAVLSTALAYVLFFRISATAGATNVMLVTLLIPVTATGLGRRSSSARS